MPYVAPATVVTATTITSAWGNSVKAATDFLANPPACRVWNNAAISVANSTWVALTFNSERWDTNTMHDTVTNTGRITIVTAGLYILTGHAEFAANATGMRGLQLLRNTDADGIAQIYYQAAPVSTGTAVSLSTVWKFVAGDYVQLRAFQNSGGALNVNTNPANTFFTPEFSATWIGLG